jgi:hypothetical protein
MLKEGAQQRLVIANHVGGRQRPLGIAALEDKIVQRIRSTTRTEMRTRA